MRFPRVLLKGAVISALALVVRPATGQTLYSENFDGAVGPWNINYGADVNVQANEIPNFSFDYTTIGIPAAPSQVGGSTKGMRLNARLSKTPVVDPASGVSVSPTGQGFNGNYSLTFDLWSNVLGAGVGGAADERYEGIWEGGSGSTIFSNYGILSNGTGANHATADLAGGNVEALFFSNSGEGQTNYDYRVYGPGNPATDHGPNGFRGTVETTYSAELDAGVTFADAYPAGHPQGMEGETNRGANTDLVDPTQNDGELYRAAFPSVPAPEGQQALYPDTQFNVTMPGALGMAWRQVEIKKVGNIVTWSVLNSALPGGTALLATVELDKLKVPANSGNNIMFGHMDHITGLSSNPDFNDLSFTLIDNIKVTAIAAPVEDADFDNDSDVDGGDFLIWQRGLGAGTNATGDANGDNQVNATDLAIWKTKFGMPAAAAVPEPAAVVLALGAAAAMVVAAKSRRRCSNA